MDVRPAGPADWDDLVTLFGTRGDPSRCWCQWFRLPGPQWRQVPVADRRAAFRGEVVHGCPDLDGTRPPGVIARIDGTPAGWCAIGPRPGFPRLTGSAGLRAAGGAPDDPGIWSVTCFVVGSGYRRRGLSAELLDGAVALARSGAARTVEGYPVDLSVRSGVTSAELYHGVLSTFLAAGFTEVHRTSPARPVVRLPLH